MPSFLQEGLRLNLEMRKNQLRHDRHRLEIAWQELEAREDQIRLEQFKLKQIRLDLEMRKKHLEHDQLELEENIKNGQG